jgi:hypothetical protein
VITFKQYVFESPDKPFMKGMNTVCHVRNALMRSGAHTDPHEILSSHFRGKNASGHEIHHITFHNHETGKLDSGHVYVDHKGHGDF